MKKQYLKLSLLTLIAAALATFPIRVTAADAEKPAVEKPASPPARSLPFRGKLAAVDKTLKTITVGERVFQVTSQTKINKDGKPAILEDGVMGEDVSGAYIKAEDGKLTARTINFGNKSADSPASKPAPKPKEKAAGEAM